MITVIKYKLKLPNNYATIDINEMMYIHGGEKISYKLSYATTGGAAMKAASYLLEKGWNNISHYDLTAEIWFHAYAFYNGALMNAICNKLGYSGITNTSFWKSLANGIDVVNGKDTELIFGVNRYVIFRAAYAYALVDPAIL